MKIYTDLQQGTDEWLQTRLGKFTASNADAIATNGVGLQTLCFEKAAEVLTGKQKENFTNGDMDRGHELEEMARNSYEVETGIVVKRVGFIESASRIGCSPDGLIDEDGMQEIKCPNDANFVKYKFYKKPDTKHVWQMQMQMLVSGRKWVDYVVFNPNFPKPIIIVRIERDEAAIEKLQAGLDKGVEILEDILSKV